MPQMLQERTFYPSRRMGFLFHAVGIAVLLMAGAYGLWRVAQVETASALIISLIPATAAGLGVPLLVYRLYALLGAAYVVERDGIRLRWGLRVEHIPADQIQAVQHSDRLKHGFPRPLAVWPGSVLGQRRMPDGRRLEYMASRTGNLIYIFTPACGYAISPADPGDFELTYQRLSELGSLAPISARSITPAFQFSGFRSDRAALVLLIFSSLLWLVLLVIVALGISNHDLVVLRFTAEGQPAEFVPAVQLFLLPVLNAIFLVLDGLLGVVFYRRQDLRALSYLLWGAGIATTIIFLAAAIHILSVS